MSEPKASALSCVHRDQAQGARVPCEVCGTPLLLVDLMYRVDPDDPMSRLEAGRRTWWEGTGDWREHTPARCQAANGDTR